MIDWMLELVSTYGGLALRWSWQATLIAGLVLILVAAFRRARPEIRLALLGIAWVKFALPPVALLSFDSALPSVLFGPPQNGLELWVSEAGSARPLAWPGAMAAIYLLGVAVAAAVLIACAWRLHRLRSRSRALDGPPLAATRKLAGRLGLSRTPELRVSDEATVPFLTGLLKPAIVLPRDLLEALDAPEIERVVAHELAHLRHGDLWLNWLQAVFGVVWWFHPLFWILAGKAREVAEERSDSRVVGDLGVPPALYARTLVRSAAACVAPRSGVAAAALLGGRHPLERRLKQLACPSGGDRLRAAAGIAAAFVAGWLAVLGTVAAEPPVSPLRVVFAHDAESPDGDPHEQHGDHRSLHSKRHRH